MTEYTLYGLERLLDPGVPDHPHVVLDDVYDLWLSICGAHLHPSGENRARLRESAERASAASEERTPGRGVSVDAILRWAEAYEASRTGS